MKTIFLIVFLLVSGFAQANEGVKRTEDVVYGRKFGVALTMDVFQPPKPNGAAVLFVVSGGWVSNHDGLGLNNPFIAPFVKNGYTVFAVCHACQPKFQIPEIIQDMQRSVRFIRAHAKKYGIDPTKIGVTGGSAGGHLSLILGTQGKDGDPAAKDAVDKESSSVAAIACFCPPTDFLNYGVPGEDATGVGTLKNYKPAFGSRADTAESRKVYGREISPIYFISEKTPPTLIVHGDVDTLVPIYQAEQFVKKVQSIGVPAKLIVKPGKSHFLDLQEDLPGMVAWFDQYLLGKK